MGTEHQGASSTDGVLEPCDFLPTEKHDRSPPPAADRHPSPVLSALALPGEIPLLLIKEN